MDLSYLRTLSIRTAGRIDFGERARPAGRFIGEREALEQTANTLDDLARNHVLSIEARRVAAAAALDLMKAGY